MPARLIDILIGIGLGIGVCSLATLLWSSLLPGSPTRGYQTNSYKNQTSTTESDNAQNQRVFKNQQSRPAQDQSAADESPEEQESGEASALARYTKWLMVFTGVLAVATIILAASTIGLWRYAGEQAKETKRLITAVRATAGAAKQSADISERALISTQRAFVFIQNFTVYVVGNEIRIMPLWENSGVTPANPFRNYVNWRTFNGPPPADFEYPDLDVNGNPIVGRGHGEMFFIGPKATMFADIIRIPIPTMEEARSGRLRIYIWGWAEYNDTFSGTKVHRSEFCREMLVTDVTQEGERITAVVAAFRVYGKYNSAD
jgi:hypothetical protein